MKIVLVLIAGAVACLLLALYGAQTRRAPIQEQLWNQTKNALASTPIKQLVITADGREITLRGIVNDEQTKKNAARAVGRSSGVHSVTNLLEVREPEAQAETEPVPPPNSPAARCQQEFADTLRREQIRFQPSWYGIASVSFPLLDRLAEIAQQCPDAKIEISGHTDSYGILENNMALSRNRAQEVANYLIAKGIPSARLTVVGHGPTKPIADNTTAEGKEKNRRIEFNVIAP